MANQSPGISIMAASTVVTINLPCRRNRNEKHHLPYRCPGLLPVRRMVAGAGAVLPPPRWRGDNRDTAADDLWAAYFDDLPAAHKEGI